MMISVIYPSVIFVLSFWSWRIFENNLILFIQLLVLSVLFYIVLVEKMLRAKLQILTLLGVIVLSIVVVPRNIDKSIWQKSELDLVRINTDRSYYPVGIGRYFHNKIVDSVYKYKDNVFTLLDPNYYFFSTHPRELGNLNHFEKFPFVFIVFFIFGVYKIYLRRILFWGIPLLLVSGLIDRNYNDGPVLLFPVMVAVIAVGLKFLIEKLFLKRHE